MDSKKQRKFKVWENKVLFQTLEKIVALEGVLRKAELSSGNLETLPSSVVPSQLLYDICVGYMNMYGSLEKQDLLDSGSALTSYRVH